MASWAASSRGTVSSTRSLDRMRIRAWLAIALIIGWALQTLNLWPLPSDVAAKMLATTTPDNASVVAAYETNLWIGWVVRAFLIPLGIVSGVLALRNHAKWPIAAIVVAIATLILFRAWQWWAPIYAPLFGSFALDRAAWLARQPFLLFNTLIFPIILVASAIYGIREMRAKSSHAI